MTLTSSSYPANFFFLSLFFLWFPSPVANTLCSLSKGSRPGTRVPALWRRPVQWKLASKHSKKDTRSLNVSKYLVTTSKGSDSCLKLGMTLGTIRAVQEILPRLTAGIYTSQSSLTAHLPVEIDSLCFLPDECLFEPLVAFEWTAVILLVPALWWFIEWELQRNLLHHRANLFRFSCVNNISSTWPTRVYKFRLLRKICLLVLNYFVFLSIHHLSLTFTVSPPLFSYSGFMNNICYIASLSLKVTLVNYWSGQMITGLTSVCSCLPVVSVFMFTLFLLVFLETLVWRIAVYCYCWGSVGAFTETWNVKLQM